MMQIEPGKIYRTRDGQKVGPLDRRQVGPLDLRINHTWAWSWFDAKSGNTFLYTDDGSCFERGNKDLVAEWVEPIRTNTPRAGEKPGARERNTDRKQVEAFAGAEIDVRQHILDTAGRIVTGNRRKAYGTPEMNFERIARFWQAYFDNTGRDVTITAKDVSPMMRLMKEARLCDNPRHLDSLIDIVGYTLTGAEVNGVKVQDDPGRAEGGAQ